MLDRIDIHIEVLRVDYEKLSGDRVRDLSWSIFPLTQMQLPAAGRYPSFGHAPNVMAKI
jgi:hypothetical protein